MTEKNKGTVLIVEDDPLNKILVKDILTLNGYETIEAGNGQEAVDMASTLKPALILMDINLPGMDGITATGLIKAGESTKHIPVFAITASVMKGVEKEMIGRGFDGFVAKPIDMAKLIEIVRSVLAGSDAG